MIKTIHFILISGLLYLYILCFSTWYRLVVCLISVLWLLVLRLIVDLVVVGVGGGLSVGTYD